MKSKVRKLQAQRLLLLRHGSKCEAHNCTATKHCAVMKDLWQHIAKCKNKECKTPHCVTSRYVLSHYHRCKNKTCEVCTPVRLMVKASKKREAAKRKRDVVKAKRRRVGAALTLMSLYKGPSCQENDNRHRRRVTTHATNLKK